MKTTQIKPYFFAILSMLMWGMTFIWGKEVLDAKMQPLTLITIRLIMSSTMMFVIFKSVGKIKPLQKADLKPFLLLAFFEPLGYFLGETFGLSMVSPTIASIIISTIPLFTPIAGFVFYKERISFQNIAGIILSFCGLLIMIVNKNLEFTASILGILLLFMAVISAIFYGTYLKKLSSKYNSVSIVTYQNIFGTLFFIPLFFIFEFKDFQTITWSTKLISNIFYLAIIGSSLAFILYASAIRDLGMTKTNVFTNTIPIFTALFSFLLGLETFTLQKTLGVAVVIIGLFLSQIRFSSNS